MSLTAGKHAHLTKTACLFIMLFELYGRESIENKQHSTEHPEGRERTKHPKSKTKLNSKSKTKHPKSKTKPPICRLEDRFDQRQKDKFVIVN